MSELGTPFVGGKRKGKPYAIPGKRVATATFADCGENERDMEQIGTMGGIETAHSVADLESMREELVGHGVDACVYKFDELAKDKVPSGLPRIPEAAVLVIKRHDWLVTADAVRSIERDLWKTPIDTMALMGRGENRYVKNKNARHNNCMTDAAVRPPSIASKEDYADGKGSVVDLQTIPELASLRDKLAKVVKRDLPVVENNFYYEIGSKCGIGWHGDKERRITVLMRFGEASKEMDLKFQFFWNYKATGPIFQFHLKSGDIVVMSRLANGKCWDDPPRRRWTMRHATGKSHSKPKDPVNAGTHIRVN